MDIKSILIRKDTLILFNAMLLVCILILLLVVIRDMFAASVRSHVLDSVTETGSALKGVERFEDYAVVLQKNPFGFDAGDLTAITTHVEMKKGVSMNIDYKLIGTIATGKSDSFAVFLQSDGKQVLYRVKDSIPGLGVLDKVERDKVFVRSSDGLRELGLADIKGGNKGRIKTSRNTKKAGKEEFVRRKGDGSYILNAKIVQESISNPQRLMTDARLFPRYKDGKQEGFVLKEVRKGGIYDSLGLKNGDVLLRVNEYDITNPESALQAFTALKGIEKLQLDVIRNNQTVTQTYHIR